VLPSVPFDQIFFCASIDHVDSESNARIRRNHYQQDNVARDRELLNEERLKNTAIFVEDIAVQAYFNSSMEKTAAEISDSCVCFWSTNVVDLITDTKSKSTPTLEQLRDWKKPCRPLQLDGSEWYDRATRFVELTKQWQQDPSPADIADSEFSGASKDVNCEDLHSNGSLDNNFDIGAIGQQRGHILDFTFQAQLPEDCPPTASFACARYFYSVVLCAQMKLGKVSKSLIVRELETMMHYIQNC